MVKKVSLSEDIIFLKTKVLRVNTSLLLIKLTS